MAVMDGDKRDRSPKFPDISLTLAVERASALYRSARGSSVRLSDAAADWGLSSTSSSTLRNASALISYGLLEDDGSGEDRKVRLSETANRILNDKRPGVREHLLAKSALLPPIMADYYLKWGRERPNDQHAVSMLVYDSNFTDRAARTFLGVYDDALTYLDAVSVQSDHSASTAVVTAAEIVNQHSSAKVVQSPDFQSPTEIESVTSATVRETLPAEKTLAAANEVEWLRVKVGRDTTVRILCSTELTLKMVERLAKILETQIEMMGEDF